MILFLFLFRHTYSVIRDILFIIQISFHRDQPSDLLRRLERCFVCRCPPGRLDYQHLGARENCPLRRGRKVSHLQYGSHMRGRGRTDGDIHSAGAAFFPRQALLHLAPPSIQPLLASPSSRRPHRPTQPHLSSSKMASPLVLTRRERARYSGKKILKLGSISEGKGLEVRRRRGIGRVILVM